MFITSNYPTQRYYHQGAVMELVPGQTPVMKPTAGKDDTDAGVC